MPSIAATFFRSAAEVGRQHDVLHGQQCCGHLRLVREDVEGGATTSNSASAAVRSAG
jgi:hypothetical protein